MFCGVLGWFGNQRYLADEPVEDIEHWVEDIPEWNPWYAPIEDEE